MKDGIQCVGIKMARKKKRKKKKLRNYNCYEGCTESISSTLNMAQSSKLKYAFCCLWKAFPRHSTYGGTWLKAHLKDGCCIRQLTKRMLWHKDNKRGKQSTSHELSRLDKKLGHISSSSDPVKGDNSRFPSKMSSEKQINSVSAAIQQSLQHISLGTLCKSIATWGLVLLLLYTVLFNHPCCSQTMNRFALFKLKWPPLSPNNATTSVNVTTTTPTSISHIVFAMVSSVNTWKHRKSYVESWWRPNVTRGYIFLDRDPSQRFHPWPSSSPPFRVNAPVKFRLNRKYATQVRIVRTIMETFMQGDKDVRWYVMADDDTVLFIDNLVEVLAKYNHTEYFYIGMNSESVSSNVNFSFEMAFGGAGYALSYPLAQALSTKVDGCIQRYPNVYSSDFILQTCLADFGVPLTHHRGFHQIDLHGDISGLLSAHHQSPVLSLHHIDVVDPIFPSMNRSASVNHLMEAAKVDHSRLLEQTICYQRKNNWSLSTSWGYSAHIYENIHPRSFLLRPIETFRPWLRIFKPPFYMFNTRSLTNDPCDAPHEFFMESVEKTRGNLVVSTYTRKSPRNLPPCSSSGNHSANYISKIQVFSSATTLKKAGLMECCDVEETADMNITRIKLRACMKDEVIA